MVKKCSKCQKEKEFLDFYKDKRTPTGLKAQCKTCHTEGGIRTRDKDKKRQYNQAFMSRDRAKTPEKYRNRERVQSHKRDNCEKRKARQVMNSAIRSGKLRRADACNRCGMIKKLTGHHYDYTKPLDVEWLCYSCHGKEHRHA